MVILHKLLLEDENFKPILCLTGQHTTLANDALEVFGTSPDYCCLVCSSNISLVSKMSQLLASLQEIVEITKPDLIIVQGDTLSSYCGSMVAFLNKIKLAHVEAGLRTKNKWSPFPEEVFRKFNDALADFHFAPSKNAYDALIMENIHAQNIYMTGNTGVDAFLEMLKKIKNGERNIDQRLRNRVDRIKKQDRKIVLLTMHRRENQEKLIAQILNELIEIVDRNKVSVIFPSHPNPNVQRAIDKQSLNAHFINIPALNYDQFVWLMTQSDLVVTDSGGIQEEISYLGTPIIIARNETERVEILESENCLFYNSQTFENDIIELLKQEKVESKYYGSGDASKNIVEILLANLEKISNPSVYL